MFLFKKALTSRPPLHCKSAYEIVWGWDNISHENKFLEILLNGQNISYLTQIL